MRITAQILVGLITCTALGSLQLRCKSCGCSESDLIATIVRANGEVERDHAKSREQWQEVYKDTYFFLGDGIRTSQGSTAILDMSGQAELHVKEKTLIRFMSEGPESASPGAVGMDVQSGEAELIVTDEDFEVMLSQSGHAILSSGGRARLRKNEDGKVDLEVQIGRAVVFQEGKEAVVLGLGESIQIDIGATQLLDVTKKKPIEEDTETQPAPDTATDTAMDTDSSTLALTGAAKLEVIGKGAKIRLAGQKEWKPITAGSTSVLPRTTISLPNKARAKVDRDGERATLVGAGEFKVGGLDEPLVQTRRGKVIIESATKPVTVVVPGGRIVTASSPGNETSARIDTRKDGTLVRVQDGELDIHTFHGSSHLEAGDKKTIEPPTKREAEEEEIIVYDTGPQMADLAVSANESFVVHTISPPVVVGFRTGNACPGEAVVIVKGRKQGKGPGTKGQGIVRVSLARGNARYKVHCLDAEGKLDKKVVGKGQVLVLKDSGRAVLPKKPPSSKVDVDGRSYTISYQNRLPILRVQWPNPPRATSYNLKISSASQKNQNVNLPRPKITFSSGSFSEGSHRLSFQAVGRNRSSKTSTVQIRFDNAAPKASVMEPDEGSFGAGQVVQVRGITLPGWTVSAFGGVVRVDGASRFKGEVRYGGAYRGIALRILQSGRRVHYYLRRASGMTQ